MRKWILALLLTALCMTACQPTNTEPPETSHELVVNESYDEPEDVSEDISMDTAEDIPSAMIQDIPEYNGEAFIYLNDNEPFFSKNEFTTKAFESYSEMDSLGRCQVAYANIGKELMPTEERGPIGMVKPSGWHTVKYDNVDGKYLYNRCHLIGFQLTGENANEKNLITGTRYMNVEGMLPFENKVADYIQNTGNHVLYRVTPVYEGENLVASGVKLEAASVEDDNLRFHVYCYNVQPGIEINYEDGSSWLQGAKPVEDTQKDIIYIGNKNSMIFHRITCDSVPKMSLRNRVDLQSVEMAKEYGYKPCKACNP